MAFDLYADPGHSWLKVPKSILRDLGIADKVTPYSYQRGEFAYLEEDVDAPLFIGAMESQYGVIVKFREHVADNDSKIRNYDQYNPADGGPDSAPEAVGPMGPLGYGIKESRKCPTCGYGMVEMDGRYTCVNCGATMGEYRPREPMRRPDVRVRGHKRQA